MTNFEASQEPLELYNYIKKITGVILDPDQICDLNIPESFGINFLDKDSVDVEVNPQKNLISVYGNESFLFVRDLISLYNEISGRKFHYEVRSPRDEKKEETAENIKRDYGDIAKLTQSILDSMPDPVEIVTLDSMQAIGFYPYGVVFPSKNSICLLRDSRELADKLVEAYKEHFDREFNIETFF